MRYSEKKCRVFFALWPPAIAQHQFAALADRLLVESLCSGRATAEKNVHLTLVYVGEANPRRLNELCSAANAIQDNGLCAFDLVFEELRYWHHNRIVYVGVNHVPPELTQLVNVLRELLSATGFLFDGRVYIPHITLMRKASCRRLPKLAAPIGWRTHDWVLVKSEQIGGVPVYTPIRRWFLG